MDPEILYQLLSRKIVNYNKNESINEKEDITYNIKPNKLYTVKETAQILRVEPNTIYKWKYNKKLPFVKSGGKLLFKGSAIKSYLGL